MTMMVRIHEAVKAKRPSASDDFELPFLSSREELDQLKEKLADQQENKKMVSFPYHGFVFFMRLHHCTSSKSRNSSQLELFYIISWKLPTKKELKIFVIR